MRALLVIFALLVSELSLRADCAPGEKQVETGDIVCDWVGGSYYACWNYYYCVSACDPYECADAAPRHRPVKLTPPVLIPVPMFWE